MTVSRARINIARLMPPELPQFIHPLRLAGHGERLSGSFKINELKRLQAAVLETDGALTFNLEFGRDAAGIACIIGSLSGQVAMTCQRCMQPLTVAIDAGVALGIVQGKAEAGELPEEYEPLLVDQQPLKLAELVEDEALLALPFAPLHAVEQCSQVPAATSSSEDAPPDEEQDTHRPFADKLAGLKPTRGNGE